jgi:hypothetical protein
VPVLGVIAMIPAVLAVIGGVTIPILNVTLPPYENSLTVHGSGRRIWLVLGIVAYFVLRSRNPEALAGWTTSTAATPWPRRRVGRRSETWSAPGPAVTPPTAAGPSSIRFARSGAMPLLASPVRGGADRCHERHRRQGND